MVECHAGGFGSAELGEHGAYCYIVDGGGWDEGVGFEGCAENLNVFVSEIEWS